MMATRLTLPASGTILLTSGELQIEHNVTINGSGAGSLAVNGNATFRVFENLGWTWRWGYKLEHRREVLCTTSLRSPSSSRTAEKSGVTAASNRSSGPETLNTPIT